MKLGPEMYHLHTFHLPKKEGVNDLAGKERIQKTTKRCNEIQKISTLTSPKNGLKSAMKVWTFLMSWIAIDFSGDTDGE